MTKSLVGPPIWVMLLAAGVLLPHAINAMALLIESLAFRFTLAPLSDPVALESTFGPDVQFPFVAPDGSYLLFVRGMGDIQVSFRDSGGRWGQPVSLGEQYGGMLPIVSPDGKYLFINRGEQTYWVDRA